MPRLTRFVRLALASALVVATVGCVRGQTGRMVDTCQHLLEIADRDARSNFLTEADAHLRTLAEQGTLAARARQAMDPDASEQVGPLQQCVWRLRHETGG